MDALAGISAGDAEALRYFLDQFEPNDVVEIAYRTDRALGASGDRPQRCSIQGDQ